MPKNHDLNAQIGYSLDDAAMSHYAQILRPGDTISIRFCNRLTVYKRIGVEDPINRNGQTAFIVESVTDQPYPSHLRSFINRLTLADLQAERGDTHED